MIHLNKKGRPSKRKKKRHKFVSVSSIAEPEIADFDENHDGPKIEIPPIDDLKLASAIMNSRNNNNTDEIERVETPGLRLPGDGIEEVDIKDNGSARSDSVLGQRIDDTVSTSADQEGIPGDTCAIGTVESSAGTNNAMVDTPSGTSNLKRLTPVSSESELPTTGSTFTEQILARVSDIVKTGEQLEQELEEDSSQKSENVSDSLFQYSKDNYGIVNEHKELYDGYVFEDETDASHVPNDQADNVPDDVREEEPSIYSRFNDSDSDADEAESFSSISLRQTLSRASMQSNSSVQSRKSGSSTPSTNVTQDRRSLLGTPGFGKDSRSTGLVSPNFGADSPLYGQTSNRNSSNSVLSNQNRSKSVMSNSSGNENELCNSNEGSRHSSAFSAGSTPGSKILSSEVTGFQDSLIPSNGRASKLSQSSSQSPSQELEGNYNMN